MFGQHPKILDFAARIVAQKKGGRLEECARGLLEASKIFPPQRATEDYFAEQLLEQATGRAQGPIHGVSEAWEKIGYQPTPIDADLAILAEQIIAKDGFLVIPIGGGREMVKKDNPTNRKLIKHETGSCER